MLDCGFLIIASDSLLSLPHILFLNSLAEDGLIDFYLVIMNSSKLQISKISLHPIYPEKKQNEGEQITPHPVRLP